MSGDQRRVLEGHSRLPLVLGSEAVTAAGLTFLGGRLSAAPDASVGQLYSTSYFYRPVTEQLALIYSGINQTLAELDLGVKDLLRVDSTVTHRDHVSSYREQRPRYLDGHRPTSTAVRVARLITPEPVIQLTPIAVSPSDHGETQVIDSPAMAVHSPDAFSKGLKRGGWLFVSGATASAHSRDVGNPYGLADEAAPDENYWAQSAIKLQTKYVLSTKIRGVLESAGLGLHNIVRANVFLTDCERDLGPFSEEWLNLFQGEPPATIIAPVDGLGLKAARIEISVIAYEAQGDIVRVSGSPADQTLPGCPVAVRAGGLVWCSSVADLSGDSAPGGQGETELPRTLNHLERVLAAAGAGLDTLVFAGLYAHNVARAAELVAELTSRSTTELPAISFTGVDAKFYGDSTTMCVDAVAVAG